MTPEDERTPEELEAEVMSLEEPTPDDAPEPEEPVAPPTPVPTAEIEPPEPPEERWTWVGDKSHPDNQEGDGISDLFKVEDDAISDDPSDVTNVDIEEDVLDADEDGSLDSVVGVDEEDILGEDLGTLDEADEVADDVFEEDISDLLEGVDDDPFKEREATKAPVATPARARRVRRTWKPYKPYSGLQGVQ
jgi:hypothetical protein